MGAPRLELRGIRKAYPAVVANDGIDLAVAPGEVHAVIGENGAGKSTLMKIIYGMVRPDAGDMLWEGREVLVRSPADAQRLGIGMVFQHFALFDTLTVAQNIALASPARGGIEQLSEKIAAVSQRYGLPLEPDRPVYSMSVGERQRVEIVRALMQAPGLLIMDEPTSVLTPQAVREAVRDLAPARRRGLQHPLHQPQAGRDPQRVRQRDRAARRQGDRRGRSAPRKHCHDGADDDRRRFAGIPSSRRGRARRRPAWR